MLRKTLALTLVSALLLALLAGCAGKPAQDPTVPTETTPAETQPAETTLPAETEPAVEEATEPTTEETAPVEEDPSEAVVLPDGTYCATFDTDSSMFHVNEAHEGKGILTVQDGVMTIHVTLAGTKILNLYPGTAEAAQAEGAQWLEPSEDEVLYSDGMTDVAYGFDIPVPALDTEFDCALVGTKGTWYDHKVSVSNPVRIAPEIVEGKTIEVSLSGGSGRASISSPALLMEDENGVFWSVIVWSSKNYEYMLVDGVRYDPIQEEEDANSTFLLPVVLDEDMAVSALNVAMSEPHMIDYVLHFDSSTVTAE